MLKALVLTIENEDKEGLAKSDIKPIYDLVFPDEPHNFDEWFESAKRYTKQKEEWQIVMVLDDNFDSAIFTYAMILNPKFTSTADYLP